MDINAHKALELWHKSLRASVRSDGPDLSARQMALMMEVYLTPPPHTVGLLAENLNISKPAITRALDTMGRMGLVKRKRDESDRRNVHVQRTVKGSVFLREFGDIIVEAAKDG